MLSIDDHVVSGTLKNQGVGLAPAGHTVSLSVGGVQYDEVVIEVNLAPGQETLFTFPHFYFQCEEFSQGLIAEADVLSEVTESNETNNTRPLIILCEAPLAIIDGPRAEVGNGQASITWETNVDANSLCDYGLAAGLYGDRAERTTPTRYHKLILDDLLPGTTYQYRVTSINPYGIRTQSRPAYFTTGMTGDSTPPIIKSLTIVREPGVPLVYRMEAEAWDADSGVRQVQFFMDDELIGTDYSEPFEFLLTPGMLALSREEFFRSHRFSAVAVDGAMLATDHSTLFTPAYECAEIVAEFVEPYHNETLYTRNTTPWTQGRPCRSGSMPQRWTGTVSSLPSATIGGNTPSSVTNPPSMSTRSASTPTPFIWVRSRHPVTTPGVNISSPWTGTWAAMPPAPITCVWMRCPMRTASRP